LLTCWECPPPPTLPSKALGGALPNMIYLGERKRCQLSVTPLCLNTIGTPAITLTCEIDSVYSTLFIKDNDLQGKWYCILQNTLISWCTSRRKACHIGLARVLYWVSWCTSRRRACHIGLAWVLYWVSWKKTKRKMGEMCWKMECRLFFGAFIKSIGWGKIDAIVSLTCHLSYLHFSVTTK